ncbi:L-alanine dehydrogenase [Raineyella antarctica]|uniref:Alanine dehydrogenase n=1 Tax=Raineyella antarctica TaxID=1577474 RepID=A0A1G6GQQ7_9ACTN|nr:alanine dehydrogenase [Raineyella antarctica]SDB84281.1 L-alanine dehydrogenase [Raineyella antarctica]
MRIGVPTEVKNNEERVALTPSGVHELVRRGHDVLVQAGAGAGSSIPDKDYAAQGARIEHDCAQIWAEADLVLKVKEPVASEWPLMRSGQMLFTYLHLAASPECTRALIGAGTTAIAYETVQLPDGTLPLLYPMSEVAGSLAPQIGAVELQASHGGRGILMGGVAGVASAHVVIIGGGVAGQNAARVALGMGADVTVLDTDLEKLRHVFWRTDGHVDTLFSTRLTIADLLPRADLVIGSVLIPGARAPKLVTNEMVATMRPGSVLIDIAVDQGGCFEDSRPTTHSDPTFRVHGSLFYCVANMPGAVPHTSTYALTNSTLPYVLALADKGWRQAMRDDPALAGGLNVHAGRVTHRGVAEAHGLPLAGVARLLGN